MLTCSVGVTTVSGSRSVSFSAAGTLTLNYHIACDLQDCLGRNTYHPEKCDNILRQLYECCQQMYKANPQSESSACPIPTVVDRWMKDHPK
ncbi:hypothetical protein GGU11DRAFT_126179 [Lentinula aff. detonsa]|nr:hypothetical protein GGU11DRAFT_126179 [Lentinula aff. detonsa]